MSTSSDWAAWAQAIGSIAAVIAAFSISKRQFDSSLRLQRSALTDVQRSRQAIVRAMLESALVELEEIYVEAESGNATWLTDYSAVEMAKEIHQTFRVVSPLDAPNVAVAQCLIKIKNLCEVASWNIGVVVEKFPTDPDKAREGVAALKENIDELRAICNKLK